MKYHAYYGGMPRRGQYPALLLRIPHVSAPKLLLTKLSVNDTILDKKGWNAAMTAVPYPVPAVPPQEASSVYRMPAEWAPHERCLMAWPTRQELWGAHYEAAKEEYAAVAHAIAAFEPVLMVVRPGSAAEARHRLGSGVAIVELPIDDSWLRDSGPIFVTTPDGRRAGVDFRFNSWGERFLPYDDDARIAARLLTHLGEARWEAPLVLEGGSITVDGEGTLITTEQCLLNPNRNPALTRGQIEENLRRYLGVSTIIWLPYGQAGDAHTDGHVDGVCTFVCPGVVLVQSTHEPHSPDYARLGANRERLEAARDAAGRRLRIVELPHTATFGVGTEQLGGCYTNVYLANGGVVVPLYGLAADEPVLDIMRATWPERAVVGVPARIIAFGGGGVHCITQQMPLAEHGHA